ncbi:hypothetical protein HY621_00625 [Candidatus Uhrbacteria bacterium]|nr:hypothetical protein [Candidatus Uhrbacteria bacterium]
MSLIHYLIILSVGTLISWGAWYTVIANVSPSQAGPLEFFFFYASLTCALTGTFSLIGFLIRLVLLRQELMFRKVAISFRQAFFFSLLIDGVLVLQSYRLLTWYNITFLLIGITVAELFIISRKPMRLR